ncbi:class I SAM-dependent methyltransferase [Denitrificimonas caeni]|uniref:class I SAM-dependent methyltransferase n=1 Tax=Denitrificimonas caeni TaxID=521720 RepID=UPI0019657EA8|nr:class I SAM-dependent methyltransferase [Denitrificimonas caeni]
MDPRSQVLLRNIELFNGKVLLAGLPFDELLTELPQALGWSWHAGEYAGLASRFPERCTFSTQLPSAEYSAGVLFLPKSRELTEHLMQELAAKIPGGLLFMVGEKREGAERAAKQLATFGRTSKVDSARHCQLWRCEVTQKPEALGLDTAEKVFTVEAIGQSIAVHSLPGVFSHGRLDLGTQLLLECLDGLPAGHYLDFGCGAGVVGSFLKKRYPDAEVTMLDVDAFAVRSSELTLAANQLDAVTIAGDGIHAAPKQLAAIISNPPFHQGVHTQYQTTETLLREAAEHLQPGGELRIVANSFLKYPPLIEQHLGPCTVLAERNGFKVYRAVRR